MSKWLRQQGQTSLTCSVLLGRLKTGVLQGKQDSFGQK